jgi:hypothetical protein
VLKSWFGHEATDDFIWEVCRRVDVDGETIYGWDVLQPPSLYPRKHRELLKAIVEVRLNLTPRKINLRALDAAYHIAFPKSTPINVYKKKR